MEPIPSLWGFFVSFPIDLAEQSKGVIVIISVVTAVVILAWRRHPKMEAAILATPLALYGGAWIAQWLAQWLSASFADATGVFWVLFSLLIMTSLIWSMVNLIRVIVNK